MTNDEPDLVWVSGNPALLAAGLRQDARDAGYRKTRKWEYDFWRGEESLLKPVPIALDAFFTKRSRRFAASDDETRARIRDSTKTYLFYQLLTFTKRACVLAIREKDPEKRREWLMDGATAVAMVRCEGGIDSSDINETLAHVLHAAKRTRAHANELLRSVGALAEPTVAKLIKEFPRWPRKHRSLRDGWGYDEVETEVGVGLIEWGFERYRPTFDLKRTIIEIADLVEMDKYQCRSVSVAEDFNWAFAVSKAVRAALRKARAVADICAELRPGEHRHPDVAFQTFDIKLVELADAASAKTLVELVSEQRPEELRQRPAIAVAEKRLFCLATAGPSMDGVGSFETPKSLLRFKPGLTRILRRHTAGTRSVI